MIEQDLSTIETRERRTTLRLIKARRPCLEVQITHKRSGAVERVQFDAGQCRHLRAEIARFLRLTEGLSR